PAPASAGATPIDFEAARRHGAFQPIGAPVPPEVSAAAWPASPGDRFLLARLEAAGLSPAPAADRRTLIRRVHFDLAGLPPAVEDVEDFVNDPEPQAFARVVDRLLASPHYGERWGRHWLDVARYADTKDLVLLYGKDAIRPDAYTYRDYVIRAFNADVPYDRFIHEQLAADTLDVGEERWRLAAMGFLTLGRLFDKNPHDIYDDQIDTVTRGLLALTVSCARCHDHKYDAIPTEDYYALYGVFASSEPPLERPLIADPPGTPEQAEFQKKVAAERQKLADLIDREYAESQREACARTGDYLVKIATEKPDPLEDAVFYLSLSPGDLKPQITSRWRRFLEKRPADDPVFGPWNELMAVFGGARSGGESGTGPPSHGDTEAGVEGTIGDPAAVAAARAGDVRAVVQKWLAAPSGTQHGELNPLVREALAEATLAGRGDVARAYGALFRRVYEESRPAPANATASGVQAPAEDSTDAVGASARQQLLDILTGRDGPVYFPKRSTYLYMTRVPRGEYDRLLLEVDKLAVYFDAAPPRAMVLVDSPEPYDPRVFVRGNPSQPGATVARRFLRIVAGENRGEFGAGSGRLDLARAITAPGNPLTARVMANRVWMHHFGRPIVETPSDFGERSDPPTHPELLDWLAREFQESAGHKAQSTKHNPWSLKRLHRLLLLTSAYQQSSLASSFRPSTLDARPNPDPENRLLGRFNRRRLDLEAMRDSLLAASGRLDRRMFGRPTDVAGDPQNARRTVYGLVDRQNLPGLYRVFDFASPDQSADRRPDTIVPQQALFAMNSPFMIEQSRALIGRAEIAVDDDHSRVAALYRLIVARDPSPAETAQALAFLAADRKDSHGEASTLSRREQLAQVLLLTNEFMFVD
ncbi:MAG TPA: DUF1549 and DUF1553 domain-containing protein, partial [Planctomycetaceae bacterium]|nr:DUF1549 and DUF1553 domain-containing protein [Planctomycetaceae bacterium]